MGGDGETSAAAAVDEEEKKEEEELENTKEINLIPSASSSIGTRSGFLLLRSAS